MSKTIKKVPMEVKIGLGFQLWEMGSEEKPLSPVFSLMSDLVAWMGDSRTLIDGENSTNTTLGITQSVSFSHCYSAIGIALTKADSSNRF